MSDELLEIGLTGEERAVLYNGLNEWQGPASPTEEFAIAMGFHGLDDMFRQIGRLLKAIANCEPLAPTEWVRTLLLTEVVFASTVVGGGLDWSSATDISDLVTITTLRELQLKLLAQESGDQTCGLDRAGSTIDLTRGSLVG